MGVAVVIRQLRPVTHVERFPADVVPDKPEYPSRPRGRVDSATASACPSDSVSRASTRYLVITALFLLGGGG